MGKKQRKQDKHLVNANSWLSILGDLIGVLWTTRGLTSDFISFKILIRKSAKVHSGMWRVVEKVDQKSRAGESFGR